MAMSAGGNRVILLQTARCVAARTRLGFSRQALADQSHGGISAATIKRIENGVPVYLDTARRLATLLGTSLESLQESPGDVTQTQDVCDTVLCSRRSPCFRSRSSTIVRRAGTSAMAWSKTSSRASAACGSLSYLRVASTFDYPAYAPPDPRRVHSELGAEYVIEGTIRRADDDVRVTARVTDARSGRQLSASQFDHAYAERFALQDRLVADIVACADAAILEKEVRERAHKNPTDMSAWEPLAARKLVFSPARQGEQRRSARLLRERRAPRSDALARLVLPRAHAPASDHQPVGVGSRPDAA